MKKYIFKLFRLLFRLMPLNNMIIFESSPDLSDNAEALYRYFLEKKVNETYKIVWLCNKPVTEQLMANNVLWLHRNADDVLTQIRVLYVLMRAKFIFDSNAFVGLQRRDQVRVHLGHGMPIKAVKEYCRTAGQMNEILVTSSFFNDIYEDLFNVDKTQILNIDLPRNDYLLKEYPIKKQLFGDKKIVFWLPTYRQHRNGNKSVRMGSKLNFGLPCIDTKEQLDKLVETAKQNNWMILFRIHPAQDQSFLQTSTNEWLCNVNDEFLSQHQLKLYEVLGMSDALITDYSSVYYDFLLTDRPIALTIDDLEEYSQTFKIALDYQKYIKAQYIYQYDDLLNFMQNMQVDAKQDIAKHMFHDYVEGQCCERLYNHLRTKYHF